MSDIFHGLSLDEIKAMSDADLLTIRGVGPVTVAKMRRRAGPEWERLRQASEAYGEAARERLKAIRAAREAGFSFDEMGEAADLTRERCRQLADPYYLSRWSKSE